MRAESMTLPSKSSDNCDISSTLVGGADPARSARPGGLAGVFAGGGGKAVTKHADNKVSLRSVGLLVAFIMVPVLFLSYANLAAKPLVGGSQRLTMTADALLASGIPTATPFVFAIGGSAGGGSFGVAANATRGSPYVIGGLPYFVTATLPATPTVTPSLTATPTPSWSLWLAVSALSPRTFRTDSGALWRAGGALDGYAAGCPASLPLGTELVTESGAVYLCVHRAAKRSCSGSVCSIWVYTSRSFPDRLERALMR
jgi:hypothetical protein